MIQGILSGAGWFAVFLMIHIAWFHHVRVIDCFKMIMAIFAAVTFGHIGTIVVLNFGVLEADLIVVRICCGLLIMACMFILYMPFYYTIVASLSIQTLICLEESPKKSLTMPELQQLFASRDIVDGRLKIMVSNGYLTADGERYRIAPKGHRVSQVFGYLKEIWRLGPGG